MKTYIVKDGLDRAVIVEAESMDMREGYLVFSTISEVVAIFSQGNWLSVMVDAPTKGNADHG